jgi:hypothetical protein
VTDFTKLKSFNNDAVNYLIKRLECKNYRGHHLVQHYRYNYDDILTILTILN